MIMQKQFVISCLILFLSCGVGARQRCENLENNVYQFKVTLPCRQPYYLLITFLPNGMITSTSNIGVGDNAAQLGKNIPYVLHGGSYDCLSDDRVHLNTIGYVDKTDDLEAAKNGAIGIDYYNLKFSNHHCRSCAGTFRVNFYKLGSDPTDPKNTPTYKSPIANVTCEYVNVRGFIIA